MAKLFETIGKVGLALAVGGGIVNSALFNGGCFIWIKVLLDKINFMMATLLLTNIMSSIFFLIFNLMINYFTRYLELYIWDCVHIWWCYPDYNISEWFSCCLCISWCRTPGCYIWPLQRSPGWGCWRRDPLPHSLGAETHHLRLSIPSTQRACYHRQQRYINYCWFDVCTFILIYYYVLCTTYYVLCMYVCMYMYCLGQFDFRWTIFC